jgi:DNA-binding transcriptional regulator YiaG
MAAKIEHQNSSESAEQEDKHEEHRLHANATTTPEMREFIQNSDLSVAELSKILNISEATVRKWKKRKGTEDLSHRPKNIASTLSPLQEHVVVELRKNLLLPLDHLLQVVREFINADISRSALDRCLRRNGVSSLKGLKPGADDVVREQNPYKDYAPDFVHVSVSKLPDFEEEQGMNLFVGIDPEVRWVYVDIYKDKTADAAARYIQVVLKEAPFSVQKVLAGNLKKFVSKYGSIIVKEES